MGCSDAVLCVARGNPRRGFPLFLAMPEIHPFLRFRTLREFRHLRMPTRGFAPGPHFLFFHEAKGSDKKFNGAARLDLWSQVP